MVASVALAFVLLVASGLLIRSFNRLMNAESGINALNVLERRGVAAACGLRPGAARAIVLSNGAGADARRSPACKSGVVTTDLPLRADGERRAFSPEGADPSAVPSSIALTWAHGDYFTTFGIPLIRGRNFTTEEQMENRARRDRQQEPGGSLLARRGSDRQAAEVGHRRLAGAVANGGRRGR